MRDAHPDTRNCRGHSGSDGREGQAPTAIAPTVSAAPFFVPTHNRATMRMKCLLVSSLFAITAIMDDIIVCADSEFNIDSEFNFAHTIISIMASPLSVCWVPLCGYRQQGNEIVPPNNRYCRGRNGSVSGVDGREGQAPTSIDPTNATIVSAAPFFVPTRFHCPVAYSRS